LFNVIHPGNAFNPFDPEPAHLSFLQLALEHEQRWNQAKAKQRKSRTGQACEPPCPANKPPANAELIETFDGENRCMPSNPKEPFQERLQAGTESFRKLTLVIVLIALFPSLADGVATSARAHRECIFSVHQRPVVLPRQCTLGVVAPSLVALEGSVTEAASYIIDEQASPQPIAMEATPTLIGDDAGSAMLPVDRSRPADCKNIINYRLLGLARSSDENFHT
jgi:hypothetical protein